MRRPRFHVVFVNGAQQASTPAQCFQHMTDGSLEDTLAKDKARRHKIGIVDFLNGAHGQTRRYSGFGKYLLRLPKIRHAATK